MHRLHAGIALFALSAAAIGATEFEGDLPIELARYFTGGGAFHQGLPDNFPAVALPAGVEVMGSLDQTTRQQVVFTRTMEGGAAQQALAGAFLQRGWMAVEPERGRQAPVAFTAPEADASALGGAEPVNLCHESFGSLFIDGNFRAGLVYLNRSIIDRNRPFCDQQPPRIFGLAGVSEGLLQWMPQLEVPAGSGVPDAAGELEDVGGGQNQIEVLVQLSGEQLSLAGINEHFAGQLAAQGWARDAEWNGELSAGSTWTLEQEGGLLLVGSLAARKTGEAGYEVGFTLVDVGQGTAFLP